MNKPEQKNNSVFSNIAVNSISRRIFIKKTGLLGISLAGGTLLEACGNTVTPVANSDKIGADTIVVAMVAEPDSLDCGAVGDLNAMRVHKSLYDGLVDWADDGFTLTPALAENWEISKDQLAYTFYLRKNVKFHDGTPFNAEAVKFNFDRWLDKNHPYHDTGPFPLVPSYVGMVKETRVLNDFTVQLILSELNAAFLPNLTVTYVYMSSPQAIKKYGKDYGHNPVGTGPFKFKQWDSNSKIELEANPDYWQGAPRLKKLVFVPTVEEQTRYSQLLSGEVNFVEDLPVDNLAALKANPRFSVLLQPSPHTWWTALNLSKPPFNDIRVRKAVNYAVNKEGLIKQILQNTAETSSGPIPPTISWAYEPAVTRYPYDPERAKALIKEAGISNTQLNYLVPLSGSGMQSPKTMATAIQADLAKIGFKVNIETYEWNSYILKWIKGMGTTYDMSQMSWVFSSGDPDLILRINLDSRKFPSDGFNVGYYQNPEVDAIFDEGLKDVDQSVRARLYKRLQSLVAEDAPWIFVDHGMQQVVMRSNIKGFTLHPSYFLRFHKAYIENS